MYTQIYKQRYLEKNRSLAPGILIFETHINTKGDNWLCSLNAEKYKNLPIHGIYKITEFKTNVFHIRNKIIEFKTIAFHICIIYHLIMVNDMYFHFIFKC